jgi:putative transposase
MRNPLKRHYGQGDLHFVTFSCYRRKPLLGTARARDRFVKILDEVRDRHAFQLIGYVVMPEHAHLLLSEPAGTTPSRVLQVLKQKVAKSLLKKKRVRAGQLCLRFEENGREESHFWQKRFYDFNVWSEKKVAEKLKYMHANPVQRRLVEHPKDWPWSSWANYEGRGEARIWVDSIGGGAQKEKKSQNPHP